MGPPPQPIHKQEHHGFSLHHGHTGSHDDEDPPKPCEKVDCAGMLHTQAKFCILCGAARPKTTSPKAKKVSALEEDCVNTSGFRRTIWLFVHTEVKDSPWILRHAQRYEVMSICMVLYLVLADIIVSIPEVAAVCKENAIYKDIEGVIYAVFTLEYVMRMWSSMESRTLSALGAIKGRWKLATGVIEMVDLVVLIAYYINFIPGFSKLKGLQALRMIRLLRVAALLKVERKASSFSQIVNVLRTKKSELVATLFTALVLMVMSATTMYYLEVDSQPLTFGSVPAAMWWSVSSLTTVGYGDAVPVTAAGKVLGSVVAFFGVGLFALPAGILGSGFVEEVDKAKKKLLQEEGEEDVADEVLGEQEEEAQLIGQVCEDVSVLSGTVEELQGAQHEIVRLLNTVCPSLEIPSTTRGRLGRSATDADLAALQDSVSSRLDSLKRNKSSRGAMG